MSVLISPSKSLISLHWVTYFQQTLKAWSQFTSHKYTFKQTLSQVVQFPSAPACYLVKQKLQQENGCPPRGPLKCFYVFLFCHHQAGPQISHPITLTHGTGENINPNHWPILKCGPLGTLSFHWPTIKRYPFQWYTKKEVLPTTFMDCSNYVMCRTITL